MISLSGVEGVFSFANIDPLDNPQNSALQTSMARGVIWRIYISEDRMNKLTFKGYASHDLDKIHDVFLLQTGNEPNAFVIRPDFVVSGSKENHGKLVMTRTGACNCVMVPLSLTKGELEKIYSNLKEYRFQKEEKAADPELFKCWDDDFTRYCIYCSQAFLVKSLDDRRLTCEKPECVAREKNRLEQAEKIKLSYPQKPEPKTELQLAEDKAELIAKITTDDDDHYSDTVAGWVYLIAADNDLCKIGHTDNVQHRFSNLATMNAAGIELRHTVFSANRMRAESWLHEQFRNKKHHGEWHRLTNEDIAWICDLKDGSLDGV